jgi:uncharacterized protein YqjF (DUF2071 family)
MGNFEFALSLAGGNYPPVKRYLPVAATQTLVVGDALAFSSGKLAKAGDGSVIAAICAQEATTLAEGTLIEVEIVQRWHVWKATASADATSYVLNGTSAYDLTAAQLVNLADTTGGGIRIIAQPDASNTAIIHCQITNPFFG